MSFHILVLIILVLIIYGIYVFLFEIFLTFFGLGMRFMILVMLFRKIICPLSFDGDCFMPEMLPHTPERLRLSVIGTTKENRKKIKQPG